MTYDLYNAEDGVKSIWVVKKPIFKIYEKISGDIKYIHEK